MFYVLCSCRVSYEMFAFCGLSAVCCLLCLDCVSVCPVTRKIERFNPKQSRESHSNSLILNKEEKSTNVQFNLKQSRDSTVSHKTLKRVSPNVYFYFSR